ncbi:sigma-70 family RNA polymerase sigma factor [Streptomyces sp. BV286]|uniref:sigma-70 family RNA polymerase sigma factor n=1 Tax=Streptomyces sp. BV286 TaxID=2849672 RepID=UPI001C2EC129|nr:sigma-70 family RNA polymerase sigma factor [Streptomyces sp. BV286]MBV1937845.1 sigma-70 family RNA polymerase sigma factor [Streptomyces sp. BV286]
MDDDFTARAGAYWPRLTRTARLLTGNAADAERHARAALAEVYARRRTPGDDAEFYVRRALVRDFTRRRPRPLARSGPTPEPYVPDPLDPLTEVLAALPPRRRAIAVLRHWDGLSPREVAALLNSSPGAVKAVGRRVEKALCAHPAHGRTPHAGRPPVPRPVPVVEVEAAGRSLRRRRRRTTALLTSAAALLLAPLVVGAVRGTAGGSGDGTTPPARTAVRVVTPGERVSAAPGVQFWLTKDGTHWSTPRQPKQFRGAGQGEGPALTLRSAPTAGKRLFLSGVHRGTREASRVELSTPDGTFTARVLTLAGSPGWSAWYADSQLPDTQQPLKDVTVKAYDSAGKLLARTDTPS